MGIVNIPFCGVNEKGGGRRENKEIEIKSLCAYLADTAEQGKINNEQSAASDAHSRKGAHKKGGNNINKYQSVPLLFCRDCRPS